MTASPAPVLMLDGKLPVQLDCIPTVLGWHGYAIIRRPDRLDCPRLIVALSRLAVTCRP